MDDIEDEFAMNYGEYVEEDSKEGRDSYDPYEAADNSLEAEFAMNYVVSDTDDNDRTLEKTSRRRESSSSTISLSTREPLKERNDCCGNSRIDESATASFRKVGISPIVSKPNDRRLSNLSDGGIVVIPHDEMIDPLEGIMSAANGSNASSFSPESVDVVPTALDASSSSILSDRSTISTDFDDHYGKGAVIHMPKTPISSQNDRSVEDASCAFTVLSDTNLFHARGLQRHRSALDPIVGSNDLALASASLFDVIISPLVFQHVVREDGDEDVVETLGAVRDVGVWENAWNRTRAILDKLVDVEMAATIFCADASPFTDAHANDRRVRFRAFDLSTVHMPSEKADFALNSGFRDTLDVLASLMKMCAELLSERRARPKLAKCVFVMLRGIALTLRKFVQVAKESKEESAGATRRSALRRCQDRDSRAIALRRHDTLWKSSIRRAFATLPSDMPPAMLRECIAAAEIYCTQIDRFANTFRTSGGDEGVYTKARYPMQTIASNLIESHIRFTLRCALNDGNEEDEDLEDDVHPDLGGDIDPSGEKLESSTTTVGQSTIMLVSKSGSLLYNSEDLAAIVCRALRCVDTFCRGDANDEHASKSSTIDQYLDACTFLVKLLSEPSLYEAARCGHGPWREFQSSIDLAEQCGCLSFPSLTPFVRLRNVDAFFEWLRAEQKRCRHASAEKSRIETKKMTKKQKRKSQRRKQNLSGSNRKRRCKKNASASLLMHTFQFPKIKSRGDI